MDADRPELPSGTVTFLFTDIERSTELIRLFGAEFGSVRETHRRLLRDAFARHHGHEIDTAGDGFFVVFQRAGDAAAAAAAAQRAVSAWARENDVPLRVRMGLHTAEPFLDEGGYVGVGVHRAARIGAVGHGGQILMSNATAGIVEDLGLEGIAVREVGEHLLKDMNRPQRLFQLDVEGLDTDFPALEDLTKTPLIGTLLATDLVGWSAVMRDVGDDAAGAAAARYHALVRAVAAVHGGRVLETVGDSTLTLFERPPDAVAAAVAVRDAVRHEPWIADESRCLIRSAVHSGRLPTIQPGQLGSTAAHVARLCATAEPEQILVSHATEALLEGEVPRFELLDLGERVIPGHDRFERVYGLPTEAG